LAIEIRPLQKGDEASLLEALNAHRGGCVQQGHALSSEELAWFLAHPSGTRTLLAWEEKEIVGHLSAARHTMWMKGRQVLFAELLGGFVAISHRARLGKRGLFARLCREFFSEQGIDGDFIYYGWPTREEWRLGRKLLAYETIRTQVALTLSVGNAAEGLPAEVELMERFDHQARWLWDRCAAKFGASAIRDEGFLNHRFVERPGYDYENFGVRDDDGVLRGYAVFRKGQWGEETKGLICDWLVPTDEPEVGRLLLRALEAHGRTQGVQQLFCLLPEWSPWFDSFQRAGFLATDAERMWIARTSARRFDVFWLRTQWFSTLADTLIV
jgi:hypothetical protein